MMARSFSMATTLPFTTEPSVAVDSLKEASSIAAKSSREGLYVPVCAIVLFFLKFWLARGYLRRTSRCCAAPAKGPGNAGASGSRWVVLGARERPTRRGASRFRTAGAAPSVATQPLIETPLDNVESRLERGFYIQKRGIEQARAGGGPERRHRPLAVAGIAPPYIGEHRLVGQLVAEGQELLPAAARPGLGIGGGEQVHLGVGADDAVGAAAIEHCTRLTPGKIALVFQKGRPDLGNGGDPRGGLAGSRRAQRVRGKLREVEGCGGPHRGGNIVEIMAGGSHRQGDGAIDQAGIEMVQAEMAGQAAGERPLAGGGRPVDGDDHRGRPVVSSAPRRWMNSRKSGKLVAIMAASSTSTGWSAASPMIRNDMAMR